MSALKRKFFKDFYQVEDDNYDSFIKFFCYHWRKALNPKHIAFKKFQDDLTKLKKQEWLDEETLELIEKDIEKLDAGLEYLDWLHRLIQTFESHRIFDYVPKTLAEEKKEIG